jgi:hypothetical protein
MLEDALAAPARAEHPVRAIARQHLVAQLATQGEVVRKDPGGKEPLEHVVVPVIAVAAGGAQLARSRLRLEHRADGVRGVPNRSFVGPVSRSKSDEDSGCSARIRSSTPFATSALSTSTVSARRLERTRNHANSLAGTSESPLCTLRRSRGARRVRRTRRARSPRPARAARGRGRGRPRGRAVEPDSTSWDHLLFRFSATASRTTLFSASSSIVSFSDVDVTPALPVEARVEET